MLQPVWDRLSHGGTGARLVRGTLWNMAGAVSSRMLGLISTVLVARLLGVRDFGALGVIQGTVGMFAAVAGFGLGLTATKCVAELRDRDPDRAGRIIAMSSAVAWITGGVAAVAFAAASTWLAEWTLKVPELGPMLRLSSVILVFGAVNGAQMGALSGLEAFRSLARANSVGAIISLPMMVVGAYLGGVMGAVCAMIASNVLLCGLCFIAVRGEAKRACIPLTYRGCLREWPTLVQFSLPAAMSSLMVIPANWVCNAFLVRQPGGLVQMGIMNVANQWRTSILLIPDMAGRAVLPMLAHTHGNGDAHAYRRTLKLSLKLNLAIASVVALAIAVVAPWIMAVYGREFTGSHRVLQIVAVAAIVVAGNNVIGQSISSRGKMWIGLCFNLMWAAVQVVASWLLAGRYGAVGLAVAILIAYLCHTIWQSIYLRHLLKSTAGAPEVQPTMELESAPQ